ncbi:MAG: hypothetical protein OEY06_03325 [Gammaproteobacteria bacterium]|nr:hypothetical protein [Gammaproteobacteria bacterium]
MSGNIGIHWKSVATEWKCFGSPLRPCNEDVRYMEKVIADKYSDQENCRVQLCGVTPEIVSIKWPDKAYISAVEQSQEMIDENWPGDVNGKRLAIKGDWLDSASNKNHHDVVIGDGCFISVDYPEGYSALATALVGTLKKNGIFIMRFFTQLEEKESSDHVFSELLAGKIGSFHAFKWRLAMSLQKSSQQGICLNDIYNAWQQAEIDHEQLSSMTGWSHDAIETISLYANKENRFSFATLAEILEVFETDFVKESIYFPQYELGERCPIISFVPR